MIVGCYLPEYVITYVIDILPGISAGDLTPSNFLFLDVARKALSYCNMSFSFLLCLLLLCFTDLQQIKEIQWLSVSFIMGLDEPLTEPS